MFHSNPLQGVTPLHITFDQVDGYIRKNDKTKYQELFYSNERDDRIFDRIKYHIKLSSNISLVSSHKHMNIEINSGDDLPLKNIKPL